MGVTIDNESTTEPPPPLNGLQPKPLESLISFYLYQIFALEYVVVEAQQR